MSQVSCDHRKKRRLQSHDMQKSGVPVRVLLGVFGSMGAARLVVVQLQPLQRGRRQEGARRSRKIAPRTSTLPALLQSLHEPLSEFKNGTKAHRVHTRKNGRNATAQHVLDRGAILTQGRRSALPVPPNAHVHLRVCLLPETKQSFDHFRGQSVRFGDCRRKVVRLFGARNHI